MCGIVGYSWKDPGLEVKCIDDIKRRGPDDDGIYTTDKITLGHSRL